ncbi:hypothetical protein D3C84_1166150 [compost metagenome]
MDKHFNRAIAVGIFISLSMIDMFGLYTSTVYAEEEVDYAALRQKWRKLSQS